jgi:hypothetical protein
MKRHVSMAAAAAALAMAAGAARAQSGAKAEPTFEDMARSATPVAGAWGLGAVLWSQLGGCDKTTSDLERRQCEGVRDARLAQQRGRSFLVAVDAAPVRVGAWDGNKKSAALTVEPCLVCDAPIDIGGEPLFVVGPGKVNVSGGAIEVAPVHAGARVFKDDKELAAWKAEVLPRLRSEFVVRVDDPKRWSDGGSKGVQVEVVAYRTYDECTGEIVASRPASRPVDPNRKACGAQPDKDPVEPEKVATKPTPKGPELPRVLSPFKINATMAPVRKQANKCFDAYGVGGKANFKITINNEGKVTGVEQTGDFVDTPTGACIEKAVREVSFPPFKKESITFDFPVLLQ